jgi:ribosomal protein S18 acetylase RimI-like enzyme
MDEDGIELVTVKSASADILKAFERLLPQLSGSARPLSLAALDEIVGAPGNTLLMARNQEGDFVGSLTLVVFPIPTGLRARIEDVVVDESQRGRRIGEKLTLEAIRVAAGRGATSVDLTTRPSREAANRLYQRLGFKLRTTNVYRYSVAQPAGAGEPK